MVLLLTKGIVPTEMTMMNEIWQNTRIQKTLRKIPIIQIQSGQRPDGTRANTDDTLREMAKDAGDVNGKSFLFISNNPYICYQDAVAKKILPPYGAEVETVGEAIRNGKTLGESIEDEKVENVLDSVARCLTNIKNF